MNQQPADAKDFIENYEDYEAIAIMLTEACKSQAKLKVAEIYYNTYKATSDNNQKKYIVLKFLEKLKLVYRSSNNCIHIMVDIGDTRLDIWPTTEKIHITKDEKRSKFSGAEELFKQIAEITTKKCI